MKFLIAILLTALLGFALPLYLWWWSFAVAAFVVALIIKLTPRKSFLAGFTGIALLWGIHAAIIDAANDSLLSGKVALYCLSMVPLLAPADYGHHRRSHFRHGSAHGQFYLLRGNGG